jgi:hypothetical protein
MTLKHYNRPFLRSFFLLDVLKLNVDWSGRCETPAGAAGQVRPHRRFSAEEAHRPPRGKRSAWNGNQHSSLTEPFF